MKNIKCEAKTNLLKGLQNLAFNYSRATDNRRD